MALRKGHGNGKGVPRIEVLPPDELPDAVAAVPEQVERRPDGTLANPEAAKALGAKGGLAKAQKKKLLHGMGLAHVTEDKKFHPYYKAAQAWLEAQVLVYAQMCGGVLGPGPSSMLGNAAIALAWARYVSDQAMEECNELLARQAGRYWDHMKQQQLAAYELGVREAKMRADLNEKDGLDAFEAALRAQSAGNEDESSE